MEEITPPKLADPKILEAIDKLFEFNVGDFVALPQLLVVGDQSSGKSSVLEGLTGLPYPRASTLCTRFATQITFRRSPTVKVAVSIIPAHDTQPEYAEKLRDWQREDPTVFDSKTFAEILREVTLQMGLTKTEDVTGSVSKTFSDDVLKIEICGPEQQHLSVIDVPGIFRKTTQGVTTKADIKLVRNMVSAYMKNPRSAMLAVIPANTDIGTQEILDMAEQWDPKGQRTLGVLTKPDLVYKGAEQDIVNIIEGRSHALHLGWCIVRNPGQQELKDLVNDRHATEKEFFATRDPWRKISKDCVGIQALQKRLVDVLAELIRREFPHVRSDINKQLSKRRRQLEALGPSRERKDQQFKYLLELATRYQAVTSLALKAHYGADKIFGHSQGLRLATAVVQRNAMFADDIAKKGHTMTFGVEAQSATDEADQLESIEDEDSDEDQEFSADEDTEEDGEIEENDESEEGEPDAPKKSVAQSGSVVRYQGDYAELEDILLHTQICIPKPQQAGKIMPWLMEVYKASQGFELGTFDPALLSTLWKEQSANWDELTMGYIEDIVSLVHHFTVELLSKICQDQCTRDGLHCVLLDKLIDRYRKGIDHARFVLTVERLGTPLTHNHYFADNLEKCRASRLTAKLKNHKERDHQKGTYVALDAVMQITNKSSNLEQNVCDLHDILKSYYKVALKRFIDVICMQAADFCLITGPDTPVRVFSPAFVSELTEVQLEAIAGEDAITKRKRIELKREIESLEKGRKLL